MTKMNYMLALARGAKRKYLLFTYVAVPRVRDRLLEERKNDPLIRRRTRNNAFRDRHAGVPRDS